MIPDVEKAFGDYIDSKEYDETETVLFALMRTTFKAGWLAAVGNAAISSKAAEQDNE